MVASALPSVGASLGLHGPATGAENSPDGLFAHQEAAEFAQKLHAQRTLEVAAVPVASPGLGSHFSSGLQEVSSKLSAWHAPSSVEPAAIGLHDPPGSSVPTSLTSAMAEAVTGLQGAYVFAIEATLVSRGSTEGTKILNTLLKGQ